MAKLPSSITDTERDEFAEGAHDLLEFFRRNWIYLALLLAAILVVFLVGKTMSEQRARIGSEINERLTAGIGQLNALQQATVPAQRETAVTQLVESMDLLSQDFPDHPLTAQAIFIKARALYAGDRFEEARTAYNEYIQRAEGDEMIARGEIGIGYAYENESFIVGDQAKQRELLTAAIGAYEKAAQRMRGSYLEYYALLAQARVREAMNSPEEAIRLYKRVADERPYPSAAIDDDVSTKPLDAAAIAMNANGEIFKELVDSAQSQMTLKSSARVRLKALEANVRARPMPTLTAATAVATEGAASTATATVGSPVPPAGDLAPSTTATTTTKIDGVPVFPIPN